MKLFYFNRVLVIGVFSLIYFALAFVIITNNKSQVDFIKREIIGLNYHKELMLLTAGERKTAEIDIYFKENLSDWLKLDVWNQFKDYEDREKLHDFMLDIADKSNLILDPELPSYYMMNILVNILPDLFEMNISGDIKSNSKLLKEYQKNLNRSLQIINFNREFLLNDYSKENILNAYNVIHDKLLEHLQNRLSKKLNIFNYSLVFIICIYFTLLALGFIAVKNYISTREVRLAKEKQSLLDSLEQQNIELEQFAYTASHDLKEPVRMVANFTTLLEKKYSNKLDSEGQNYITIIVQSAKRIESMIADMLAYARMNDANSIANEKCDCNLVLKTVLDNLQNLINEANASVSSDILPVVAINNIRLVRLLQNLISNAINYRDVNRAVKVHISAEKRKDMWVFSVADNGIGIDKKYLLKIFEPFKRLHNNSAGGTGIGLAICKKIVEKAGGKIWVESKLGEGSVFYFTIPVAKV